MISPITIIQFLFGKREAIQKIADAKYALLLGFLFIVSAGLARNYDHHLLHKEFLWIGGPVVMSILSSVLIYGFIKKIGRLTSAFVFQNYHPFLKCFIMTAPLAWLYGIPVEQFTSALTSTKFNFGILLVVSFWRVALMVRVTQVLFNFHPTRAFTFIAIPASAEMFFATKIRAIDIVGIMGGMKLTESEEFLLSAGRIMAMGSLILFFGAFFLLFFTKRGEAQSKEPAALNHKIAPLTWVTSILVIIFWLALSKTPQKQLTNIAQFQKLIRAKNYQQAAELAEAASKKGFPPHHLLFPQAYSYSYISPYSATYLVNYDKWPLWLRKELDQDVNHWLSHQEEDALDKSHKFKLLYRGLEGPYLQKFADKFTPGINLSDYSDQDKAPDTASD